ncbi:hypothetical protein Glove_140g77 [Diversispora epigaea]|uniref:Protein kinase domain-containing protein n=1 Tax=Diversispora epigaea TaxID=1348612 RepID=A0A397J4Q0_9GLOM|nr:hypothetical protein Glove_140g77 [Diversispora epigaea]
MRNLDGKFEIFEDTIQEENIPFYQYSEFENVKLISRNVYEAIFKNSQKTVALKYVFLNDKYNFIGEIKRYRKLEINDSILKFYGITKQENTNNYMIILEYVNEGSLRQYLKTNFQKLDWNAKLNLAKQIANVLMFLHSNDIIHGKFIKRYRKLEINDSILKFYGITKQENTNNYMIILEYVNEGSLRQYLKTNFQKLDWNAKLNLAKQIANVLMFLHSNDIIHGKFNSENILIHNGIIKLNVFGLTKIISDSLTNNLVPIQYMDPQYLELFGTIGKNKSSDIFSLGIIFWEVSSGNSPFEMESLNVDLLNNIAKGKREMATPGILSKYNEIYTDCWKHDGNLRPDVSQVVENLSKINYSHASIELETQSLPYNVAEEVISVQLEKLNIKNEESGIKPGSPFVNVTTEVNVLINELFEILIDMRKKQILEMQPIIIKNYIREHKQNPVKILYEMIRHPFYYLFTSLVGFFYKHGIGTVVDYQMAFKFFSLTSNKIIDTSSSNSSSLRKLYNANKEISTISLADMYSDGLGVKKDAKKAFQIYSKVADEGSSIAMNFVACCYEDGDGVEKNEENAFKLYLKSIERGNIAAQSNVSSCYENGLGITKDVTKSFQWALKSSLAGNINAMVDVGWHYDNGVSVCKDKKEAFKWYLKAAEKGHPTAQYNLGIFYANGHGINIDQVKAFEWFKKAAENDADGQYRLGKCFYEGFGTKEDIVNSIYWLNKATEYGNPDAEFLLEDIIYSIID